MKMSTSSKNLFENLVEKSPKSKDNLKKLIKKHISVPEDYIKKEIYKKLNEGSILNFICNSSTRNSLKTDVTEKPSEMKYELSMINKYDEDLNSSLSFISEFDLENDENDNDNSFDSCFDENSVEEIDIIKKEKKQKNKYD
jgi:hypothetical protein